MPKHKTKNRIFAALLAAALLFSLCACGNDTADAVIRCELDSLPKTFDPQLAETKSELLAVRNLYEGLFRINNAGEAVPAAAKSYTVSDDGLTYTFSLRTDAQWRDETPLTADDFVFGFRRAADPITRSPFAASLYCIRNFSEIGDGSAALSQLGVRATDQHTLVIELEYYDPDFFNVLASAPAMPCNEAFFDSSAGQYGLTADTLLTNGSFRLFSWQESLVRVNKSSAYRGEYAAKCGAVIFSLASSDDETTRADRIANGTIDVGQISDTEFETVDSTKLSVASFEDISYVLIINPSASVGSEKIAEVFSHSFDRSKFEDGLHDYLSTADSLIPSSLTLLGKSYRSSSQITYDFSYEPAKSRADLLDAVKDLRGQTLPSVTLLYPETPGAKDIASAIALDWQENLGAFVNINELTVADMRSKVKSGEYQMAIVPVSSTDNTVIGFFDNFKTGSASNIFGFSNAAFDAQVDLLLANRYNEISADYAQSAEKILAESPNIIHIAFGHTRFAYSSGILNIGFSLTGGSVDFAFAEKKS